MHAYILTTTDRQVLAAKLIELLDADLEPADLFSQPDIVVVEPDTSITIAQVRRLQIQLSRRPLKLPKQIGLILQAETMTVPAQNAFLKLLEEPTPSTILVLATPNPYQLLPTLLSRSQIVAVPSQKSPQDPAQAKRLYQLVIDLTRAGAGERLKLIEPVAKTRESALEFTRQLIAFLEYQLHHPQSRLTPAQAGAFMRQTLALQRHLQANLNVRLALDQWALTLSSAPGAV